MATSRTPHMNITIPNNSEPGPAYASDISNGCLYPLGEHNHDGVNTGKLINIAGQLVENDLSLDGYNLTGARALRVASQGSTLNGTNDLNEFYVVNGNAYFNNSSGVPIQLTNGSSAITVPFNNFTGVAVSSTNLTIPSNASYNLINVSTASAAVTITLPLAASVTAGRFFVIQDVGNNIYFGNNLEVIVPGASGNLIYYEGIGLSSFFWTANGQCTILVSDGVANWHTFNFQKNSFVFDTFNYGATTTNYINSTINLDGYSSLLGDGYFFWNSPTKAFVVQAGAVEVQANDIFLLGNVGVQNTLEASGDVVITGKVTGNGAPLQLGVLSVTPATSMTVTGANLQNPVIYLTNGSLSADSTLTLNTSAAGIWFINVGFVTFNSHHLLITSSIGGVNITTTPAGAPASNQIITVASMGDGTALWVSTGVIV